MKWLVIAALVFAGCSKKKQEQPAPEPAGSAMAAGSATGSGSAPRSAAPDMAAGSGSAVDVPTEQDFEDQAASDITDKNVDSKLKSLESDLATQ